MFCCWGEVVVPSEPPEKEKTKKTAKYWTIIRAQLETLRLLKSALSAHQLNSKYLFCSCFNVAGYLFILFPFMVEIFASFPAWTILPFKVSRYTCGYSFSSQLYILFKLPYYLPHIFYLPYHLPVHFSFEFDFSFAVTSLTRPHYTFARMRTWTLYWNKCVILTICSSSNFAVHGSIFLDDGLFSFWILTRKQFRIATS